MTDFEQNTPSTANMLMKQICVFVAILLSAAVPARARRRGTGPVELTLRPAKTSAEAQQFRLLPTAEELTDADAVPLYEEAVQSLPGDFKPNQVRQWLDAPLDKLPRQQVQSTLEKLEPVLQLIEQAIKCKPRSWPQFAQAALPPNLTEYRELGFVLAAKARLQIAEGKYEQAIGTIQIGFAMAKHVGESPTVTQGMTGVAIAASMCRQLEQFIQAQDAPNIYRPLQELPRPLVDLNVPMTAEMSNLESNRQYNVIVRRALKRHLESSHAAVRLLMNRLDRHVAALQCVEALRLYAGAHDGKFPDKLSDVTEVAVPEDPISKKPFVYHRTGSKAALEAPAPNGATAKDAMRYLLILKE
jgi:tetratricopeptide (TPR) repeat protein